MVLLPVEGGVVSIKFCLENAKPGGKLKCAKCTCGEHFKWAKVGHFLKCAFRVSFSFRGIETVLQVAF